MKFDREMVFNLMGGRGDKVSPVLLEKEYDALEGEVLKRLHPDFVYGFGKVTGEDATEKTAAGNDVLYLIATLGEEISQYSRDLFDSGEYVRGMMADAMADAYLFGMEKEWNTIVREACKERGAGVEKNLSIPGEIKLSVQKTAFEILDAKNRLGMHLTSAGLLSPAKSICMVFLLNEEPEIFCPEHSCESCENRNCVIRKTVRIKAHDGEEVYDFFCRKGESILEAWKNRGEFMASFCAGKGRCGKCRIRIISGYEKISAADRRYFSDEELRTGMRLACTAYPYEDCEIRLCFLTSDDYAAVGAAAMPDAVSEDAGPDILNLAVDIGTTTIAACLTDKDGKRYQVSALNHQGTEGADVVSRIEAADAGKGELLKKKVQKDLLELAKQLFAMSGCHPDSLKKAAVSANTVMLHLLRGYSCSGLGMYPFTPVSLKTETHSFYEIFGSDISKAPVTLLPGISAYVGADIVSGLFYCGFEKSREVNMLIDLGTNGEMAVGNAERILVSSVAAGPAFEGGNISCGTGSVPGAIAKVEIDSDGKAKAETIDGKEAIGICGSGILELTGQLLNRGIIDHTGLLSQPYFEKGFAADEDGHILFTQKDIREVQMAKAAVRAGIEILLKHFGIKAEEISNVYLAGGFGYHMNPDKAVEIGMLPKEWSGKIKAPGNTSLSGAALYLVKGKEAERAAEHILSVSEEISLAQDPSFGEIYMQQMYFPQLR